MLKDLLLNCRSYRRFHQEVSIPDEDLKDMVDNTRLTASASNAQALKFKIVNTPAECAKVFSTVKWAGEMCIRDSSGGEGAGRRAAPPEAEHRPGGGRTDPAGGFHLSGCCLLYTSPPRGR